MVGRGICLVVYFQLRGMLVTCNWMLKGEEKHKQRQSEEKRQKRDETKKIRQQSTKIKQREIQKQKRQGDAKRKIKERFWVGKVQPTEEKRLG